MSQTESPTFEATPAQTVFVTDRNAETAYVGGVGSGKTASGVIRAKRHAEEWNVGEMGLIVAPTVPMMRNAIIPELRKWGMLGRPGIEYQESKNRIVYPNGSVVILESASNDKKIERLRAMNLAWAWIDESGYQPRKVYNVTSDRLRVGNYRNLFTTTTPRGFNWVHDIFADFGEYDQPHDIPSGEVRKTDSTTSILGVSTHANPANPEDYIERQERQRSGEAYEQEIEGKFVSFEGLVYKWFGGENRISPDDLPGTYDKTIYGLDFGGSVPTAIVCVRQSGGEWYVVDEFYEPRVTDDTIAEELQRMYGEYGRGPVYCDHEPRTINKLKKESIRAKEADKSVDEGIRHINGIRENLYVLNDCQNLVDEFNLYRYKDGKDDVLKENDHLMDALRYALFSADTALEGGMVSIDW